MRMNILTSSFSKLLKAFIPDRCRICGTVVELDTNLCNDCHNLPSILSPVCESCGANVDDCSCKKSKNEYKQIIAPYYYKDSIVKGIHNFKENDMPFLAKEYAHDMADCFNQYYSDIKFDFITFVPARTFKKRVRGFNQSELLANELSLLLNIPVKDVLKKISYSGTQHHKTAKERKADVFATIDINDKYKSQLADKTVLLVDDVKTTGATLNECAKMLKIYDSKAVYALTFAITNRDKKSKNK